MVGFTKITRVCWLLRGSQRSFTNMAVKPNLEVEKKFVCTDAIHNTIKNLALSHKTIDMMDTYYDTNDYALSCKDMWLRNRNDKYELKWPHGFGTKNEAFTVDMVVPFATDFYNESTNVTEIASVIQQQFASRNVDTLGHESHWNDWMTSSGISAFATIRSHRIRYNLAVPLAAHANIQWRVVQNVCVDIDEVTYYEGQPTTEEEERRAMKGKYLIGEVELAPDSDNSFAAVKEDKLAIMAEVFGKLGISPQPVRGKVLEYLHRYRLQHHQALRDCGQLASKGL